MILFQEYGGGNIRGGQLYFSRLHRFIRNHFDNVIPAELTPIPEKLKNPLMNLVASFWKVRDKKPRLIILDISSGIRNLLAVWWIKVLKRKVLLVVQEQRLNYRIKSKVLIWFVRQAEAYLVRNSDLIIVNSKYTADLVKQKGARSDTPVIIARPGMENVAGVETDRVLGKDIQDGTIRLLFVGKCVWHKGIKYMVEAVELLGDLDLKLDIVGSFEKDDPYCNDIVRYISEKCLENKVKFHGFIDKNNVIEMFKNASIYVHPSLMEGYGMSLAEAMSYGLPIVTTTAGAIPELIEDGINGYLVEQRNSPALAEAIRKLSSDKSLRWKMRQSNFDKAKTLPTWEDFDRTLRRELIPRLKEIAGIEPESGMRKIQ